MRIERVTGLAGMCLLMGCGGSSTSSAVETFPAQFVGLPGAVTYNDTNDTITITGRSYFPRDERFLPAEINGYKNTINTFPLSEYAIRGVAPSGTGIATSYNETSNTLERIGTTIFTPSGTVRYTGDYVGLYSSTSDTIGTGAAYVLGDAILTLDPDEFSDLTLQILNRRDSTGNLTHSPTSVDANFDGNGVFSGSDLQIDGFGAGTLNGHLATGIKHRGATVNGVLVGQNGQEAVGTFHWSYVHGTLNNSNDVYAENGVFVVGRNE